MIVFLTGAAKIAIKRPTLECELPCTDFHTLSSSPPGCVHPSDAEEARSQAMMLSASRFLSYRLWQIAPNPTLSSGARSVERRVGKEGGSQFSFRGWP